MQHIKSRHHAPAFYIPISYVKLNNSRILRNFAMIFNNQKPNHITMEYFADNPQYRNLINSLKDKEKIRVLFVCLGNICRSPAADGVMQALVQANEVADCWEIDSAGTGGWHVGDLPDNRMRIHARRRGYDLTHICRQMRTSDFDNFDLIIGMDDNNIANLKEMAPNLGAENKIVPMAAFVDKAMRCYAIPDPYYEGSEGFELVLDLLENGCSNLLQAITQK